MGYRIRLGKVSKKDYKEHYKDKTYEEIAINYRESYTDADDEYMPIAYPPHHTELFNLGKHVCYKYNCKPFYAFDIKEYGYDFYIMSKAGLKRIIKTMHKEIAEYYVKLDKIHKKLLNQNISEKEKTRCFNFVASHIYWNKGEWKNDYNIAPYYLDQENTDGAIVNSTILEYAIFNIVYIYRTFDWKNNLLIYSGW